LLRVVLFNVQLIKRVEFTCETIETRESDRAACGVATEFNVQLDNR